MSVNASFEKISLTAKLAAYMRQFSDIPFAKDVAERLRAREAFEALLRDQHIRPEDLLWYAPIFEVRYKSIAHAIRASGARQVLELASGLSLRGLAMTQDAAFTYIETDLDEPTEAKTALVAELRQQYGLADHGSLHLLTANALDEQQLRRAAQHLRSDEPVAVVNEGLFQYLSADEMEAVARNVRGLIADYGGVWITPDFSLRSDVTEVTEQQRRFRAVVAAATDRAMYNNAFGNGEQLDAFLDRLGLRARALNQVDEAPDIVSIEALHLSRLEFERSKPRLRLWVLSL
jgi:O-methyltransferase involved in polyketide biosynthesis